MSTRCQIGFYKNKTDELSRPLVLIYKHSDGYVEGTLPLLEKFHKKFMKLRGWDTEYYPARLIQFLTNSGDKEVETADEVWTTTGYGISQSLHGDIEYYYAIYENRIDIYEVPFDGDYKDMKKIIIKE